jgi:hypothetical protein
MKTKLFPLCISLVPLLFVSPAVCEQVTGQVFIVTAGHQSIKLALVPIAIYDDETVDKISEELRRSTMAEASQFIDTIEKPARALEAKSLEHLRIVHEDISAYYPAYELRSQCRALHSDSANYLTYLLSSKRLFEHLPSPIAETKTDADGNFSIDVPERNRSIVAATTTRAVLDKTESYHWLVRLAANPGKIMLSNDNMTSALSTSSPDYWRESPIAVSSLESLTQRLKKLVTALERATASRPAAGKLAPTKSHGGHN